MFMNLHLDTNSLQILCSTKSLPPTTGLSVSPPEKFFSVSKGKEKNVVEVENREKISGRVKLQRHVNNRVRFDEPRSFERNADVGRSKNLGLAARFVENKVGDVIFNHVNEKSTVEKLHTTCSTKWLSYGGCIPAILQALDTIEDLDEALSPWAEKLNNKERTIILKEQSSWERANEIFEWFKRKGCHELNVIHYNIMLRVLGRANKWSYVLRLWDEMRLKGIKPINSTYGTLIDVYSKGGLKIEALCWLGKMNKQGMQPDEVTMGIVVQMYKKAREFRKAEEFFKKWSFGECLKHEGAVSRVNNDVQASICLSSHTYNTLIDTYGKAGQVKEASETFETMFKEGIVPTTVTFNTMIHIYGNNGHFNEILSLMRKMEDVRCHPDTRTYNILISLHAKHEDIMMAASYFAKMKEARLEPDPVSYRTLLYAFAIRRMTEEAEELVMEMDEKGLEIDEYTQSALTRMYIEAGMLEKSWSWFQRFHLAGNMSSQGYSANIDAYGERGYTLEAEKAFICCKTENKLTVLEFNVMIKAYGIGKTPEKACDLFDHMGFRGVVPDKCTYSCLIQILASADMPDRAQCYLREMQDAGLVTECIPYCAVISSFVKLGQLNMAEDLYREMVQHNIKPDVVVYGVLINAFAETGSVKEAMVYVEAMKNAKIPANAVICNSLIKLYTKVGYLKEAQEIYRILHSLEINPDLYSSNCMINLYCERSMVSQAEEIFHTLKGRGIANEFTFAMLLCMYKRNGMFEEATKIAKQMRDRKLLSDVLSCNNIIGLYALDGRFKEAVETLKEMMDNGVRPDSCTFKTLGAILVKLGVSKSVVNKLEERRKSNGKSSGLDVWMSTLSAVVGLDSQEGDFVF